MDRAVWPECCGAWGFPLLRPSAIHCSVRFQSSSDLSKNFEITQENEIAPFIFLSGALCAPTTWTPARFSASSYYTIKYPPLGHHKNL